MIEELAKSLKPKGIKLKPLATNPVDRVWGRERPAPPQGAVIAHAMKYAGKAAEQKIAELQAALRKEGEDAVILTLPNSIAWLFNIRGSDVAHNPVPLAFAIVPTSGKPELFVDPAKIGPEAKAHLAALAKVAEPAALERRLAALKGMNKRIRLDPATASSWFFRKLGGGKARIVRGARPVPAAQGAQEFGRDQGRPRRPQARRGRRRALPGLARPRGAQRRARRDRRLAAPRDHPQRDPGTEGDQLRHHLGLGPERGHRPLPRDRAPPTAGSAPASFIWSTRAPSTSTAPPTSRAPSPSARRRARCASASRWC